MPGSNSWSILRQTYFLKKQEKRQKAVIDKNVDCFFWCADKFISRQHRRSVENRIKLLTLSRAGGGKE